MRWEYDDGGRADDGYRGQTGDCATRALAIAADIPYYVAYSEINAAAKHERPRKGRKRSSARTGVWPRTLGRVLAEYDFEWFPTMSIGSGTTVHLRDGELPAGRLVVRVSKHFTAVVNGVIRDTYDPSRDGTRAVYGYWIQGQPHPRRTTEARIQIRPAPNGASTLNAAGARSRTADP